jgi:hypothetical protein
MFPYKQIAQFCSSVDGCILGQKNLVPTRGLVGEISGETVAPVRKTVDNRGWWWKVLMWWICKSVLLFNSAPGGVFGRLLAAE